MVLYEIVQGFNKCQQWWQQILQFNKGPFHTLNASGKAGHGEKAKIKGGKDICFWIMNLKLTTKNIRDRKPIIFELIKIYHSMCMTISRQKLKYFGQIIWLEQLENIKNGKVEEVEETEDNGQDG